MRSMYVTLCAFIKILLNSNSLGIKSCSPVILGSLHFRNIKLSNTVLWPSGLRRGSAAARLLRLQVRIPPGHECLCCVCCTVRTKGTARTIRT
jgi:hypothetical protein